LFIYIAVQDTPSHFRVEEKSDLSSAGFRSGPVRLQSMKTMLETDDSRQLILLRASAHIHTYTHAHTHTYTRTSARTHTYTRAHTNARAHANTHTHGYSGLSLVILAL